VAGLLEEMTLAVTSRPRSINILAGIDCMVRITHYRSFGSNSVLGG
jgi:hypothetical protein